MTAQLPLSCIGVALRLLGVSVLCAVLFILDRVGPSLLGLDYFRFQDATLYLWLIVLPLAGYAWILHRSRWLQSAKPLRKWGFALGIALPLSVAFAIVTLAVIWHLG